MFESILCQVTEYDPDVLESLIGLAVEIARESREGRRVGTLFTLGDENAVLARSRAIWMPWPHKWTCPWDSAAVTSPPPT
jgi:diadenylate cyclase